MQNLGYILTKTGKSKLDINFILKFIPNSYWAKDRTTEIMQTCINNSLNFGVYVQDRQIGFARVVRNIYNGI